MAAFPRESLTSSISMPVINQINCKLEKKTEAYNFAPSIYSESLHASNSSVFEDLNVIQLGIDKTNTREIDYSQSGEEIRKRKSRC